MSPDPRSVARFRLKYWLSDSAAFLAVVSMPWQARWIWLHLLIRGEPYEYGAVSLYAGSVLLAVALALLFWVKRPKRERQLGGAFFFLWLLAGSLFAREPLLAQYYAILALVAFGYYYLVQWWGRYNAMAGLIIAAVVQVAIGWYQFSSQHITANTLLGIAEHAPETLGQSVVIIGGMRILRAYGLLPHPNMLAALTVVAFALLLYSYVVYERDFRSTVSRAWRAGYLAALLFLFSGLLITFSRAAFLALCAFLVFWMAYGVAAQKRYLLRGVATTAIACGAVFIAFNLLYGGIWLERFGFADSSASIMAQVELEQISFDERVAGYGQAAQLLTFPIMIMGMGVGNYVPALAATVTALPTYAYQPVHNVYLLMLIEIGLIGIAAAAWFVLTLLRQALTHFKTILDFQYFLSVVGIFLVIGLFDHFLWTSYFGMSLWWIALGLAAKND